MKNILVPIDFSQNALNALHYAIYLFEKEKCQFHILHVYSYPNDKEHKKSNDNLKKAEFELVEKKLSKLIEELRYKNTNSLHTFKAHTDDSFLNNAIRTMLRTAQIDFIFMGTKGATGAKRIFMGSNTVRVINDINF
jgi:nucleotide-binding universal stress UspA family protein